MLPKTTKKITTKKILAQNDTNLTSHYEKLVSAGKITDDAAQREVLASLQAVLDKLADGKKSGFLFSSRKKTVGFGLYIWGNVGRGKSMLMDLFFSACPEGKKRRIHFHAFMQEVHSRIHKIRKNTSGDPVAKLAAEIAKETRVLCFDELQATDVADASLLHRLFEGIFAGGVCVVSTSNRPPEELYTGGVQAERFNDFIVLLKGKMQAAALSSMEDYRYKQGENAAHTYHFPLGDGAEEFIRQALTRFGVGAAVNPLMETIIVHGREVQARYYEAKNYKVKDSKIGLFSFDELCKAALGAADYLKIAQLYPVIFLTDVPKLTPEQRNEAKRFVTLIDVLYEQKTRLIITAQTAPEHIYEHGDGAFEFARTVSRLTEMGSASFAVLQGGSVDDLP